MGHDRILKKILMGIVIQLMICSFWPEPIAQAATNQMTINGDLTSYSGKRVYVDYDGSAVDMKDTPGILQNSTSFVSYKNVFGDSELDANVVYNSSKKTITISKNDRKIVMTLGSKTAKVNGQKVTMSAAPMKVKFAGTSSVKILVPTEFVAQNLGCGYSWSSDDTAIYAHITSPLYLSYDGIKQTYSGVRVNLEILSEEVDVSEIPCIQIDHLSYASAKYVFAQNGLGCTYQYGSDTKSCTISNEDTCIELEVDSKEAYLDGTVVELDGIPRFVKNISTGKTYLYVPIQCIAEYLGYEYQYDSTTATSSITIDDSDSEDADTTGGTTDEATDGTTDAATEESTDGTTDAVSDGVKDDTNESTTEETTDNNDSESSLIQFGIPSEVTISQISDEDLYYNNQFQLTIAGDYATYLQETALSYSNDYVEDVNVSTLGENTVITVSTSCVCGYSYSITDGILSIIVDRPANVYSQIVLLDPGHGGTAPGCIVNEYEESDIVLEILYNDLSVYFEDSDIKVYYTRQGDTNVELATRAKYAQEVQADFL